MSLFIWFIRWGSIHAYQRSILVSGGTDTRDVHPLSSTLMHLVSSGVCVSDMRDISATRPSCTRLGN